MESSTTWRQDLQKTLMDLYRNRAKISNWAGVLGMQTLQANAREQQRNQEAESSWARRNVWGASGEAPSNESSELDEMGHTILGDITHPAPIIMPQPQNSSLPTIAAILATLAAGGLGGYVLSQKSTPQPASPVVAPPAAEFDDESLSIGLGRIEDYE